MFMVVPMPPRCPHDAVIRKRTTVRHHLQHVIEKTGARSEAALVALSRGFTDPTHSSPGQQRSICCRTRPRARVLRHKRAINEDGRVPPSGGFAAACAAAAGDNLLAGPAIGADADARAELIGLDRSLHGESAGNQQPFHQTALAIGGVPLLQECGDTLRDMGH